MLPPGFTPLSFIVGRSDVKPSPDGRLLAVTSGTTLAVYTLAGQARGHFTASSGHQVYFPGWLPDSSGLFVADADFNNQTSTPPLLIMTPDGGTRPTGLDAGWLDGDTPLVSPDNQWIADAASTTVCCNSQVELAPRDGGTKRVIADGAWVLGWQNGQIIYFNVAQAAIYAASPTGGTPQLLMQTPNKVQLYPDAAGLSPDGQLLSLTTSRGEHWVLAGSRLQQDAPTIANFGIFWTKQGHDVLGSIHERIALVDVLTGSVVRDTGIAGSTVHAVAGDWAITSSDTDFAAVNYATDVQRPLGSYRGYDEFALGQSRFLLHNALSPWDTYIVDPALLAS